MGCAAPQRITRKVVGRLLPSSGDRSICVFYIAIAFSSVLTSAIRESGEGKSGAVGGR
jgi:hypothetical protein